MDQRQNVHLDVGLQPILQAHYTMSSIPGFTSNSGSAAKNAVIQQIQQEAAIANARQLVTVSCKQRIPSLALH